MTREHPSQIWEGMEATVIKLPEVHQSIWPGFSPGHIHWW